MTILKEEPTQVKRMSQHNDHNYIQQQRQNAWTGNTITGFKMPIAHEVDSTEDKMGNPIEEMEILIVNLDVFALQDNQKIKST